MGGEKALGYCIVEWQRGLRLGVGRLGWGHLPADFGQVTYPLLASVLFTCKIRMMIFALELICICLLACSMPSMSGVLK